MEYCRVKDSEKLARIYRADLVMKLCRNLYGECLCTKAAVHLSNDRISNIYSSILDYRTLSKPYSLQG